MSRLNLSSWQRRQLAETRDTHVFRRTLAVLEFDYGRSAADIARMLGVTRQSVHDWIETYRGHASERTKSYAKGLRWGWR